MHPELSKLLDLQDRDRALHAVDQRIQALQDERASLDEELDRLRREASSLEVKVAEAVTRRGALETRIESLRAIQEKRRGRMEQVKTAREAQALTIELEVARTGLVREEGEWIQLADHVSQLEAALKQASEAVAGLEAEQAVQREGLAARETELQVEREGVVAERQEVAARIDKDYRTRYDRLREVRQTEVIVALHGAACGACYTAIPMSRRNQIRNGLLLDGCEACGVILYASEEGE